MKMEKPNKSHKLKVKEVKDSEGKPYWIVVDNDGQMRNARVKRKDTVSWEVKEANAHLVLLHPSPFNVRDTVIHLASNQASEPFEVVGEPRPEPYHYAILVETAPNVHEYVKGADSPPGVIIGGDDDEGGGG